MSPEDIVWEQNPTYFTAFWLKSFLSYIPLWYLLYFVHKLKTPKWYI